jgi:hypothetical protein
MLVSSAPYKVTLLCAWAIDVMAARDATARIVFFMKIYPIKDIGLDLLSRETIRKPKAIALKPVLSTRH